MRKCEVEGCGLKHYAKGLCSKHYLKQWKGGDPHTPSWKELTIEERLHEKLAPKDPVTGCIEWVGWRNDGYGQIRCAGKMIQTHCLAWELKHGPIPAGMEVCHRCDNPPCCNDEHLFLGTHQENMEDRDAKGRGAQPKGESNGRAKLTEADVAEIRRRLAAGELQSVIASDFGITNGYVSRIKTGKNRIPTT